MLGKVIDMNKTDAFLSFQDGTTMNINISRLPIHTVIGDTVDIELQTLQLTNNKLIDFF